MRIHSTAPVMVRFGVLSPDQLASRTSIQAERKLAADWKQLANSSDEERVSYLLQQEPGSPFFKMAEKELIGHAQHDLLEAWMTQNTPATRSLIILTYLNQGLAGQSQSYKEGAKDLANQVFDVLLKASSKSESRCPSLPERFTPPSFSPKQNQLLMSELLAKSTYSQCLVDMLDASLQGKLDAHYSPLAQQRILDLIEKPEWQSRESTTTRYVTRPEKAFQTLEQLEKMTSQAPTYLVNKLLQISREL